MSKGSDPDVTADKMARVLAEHWGVSWADLSVAEREQWRAQCRELTAYIDGTAFRGMLPGATSGHRT